MTKISIGYIPTRRDVFSKEEALRYQTLIREKISNWGAEIVDIDNNPVPLADNRIPFVRHRTACQCS